MSKMRLAIVLMTVLLASTAARADVDMTGEYVMKWYLTPEGPGLSSTSIAVQSGTDVSIDIQIFAVTLHYSGTIDPETGVFSTTGPCEGEPDGTLNGVAASDSLSYTAVLDCATLDATIVATKCGNDILDSGEICDHEINDDCCDDSCQPIAAGTSCPGTQCRIFECNGSGACVQADQLETGTPCNSGACSYAECDDDGVCQLTDPFVCDDCSICNPGAGCMGAPLGIGVSEGECVPPVDNRSILIAKTKEPDSEDGVVWKWIKGPAVDPADFGNPTLDTDYRMCVFASDPLYTTRSIAAVDLPAGGSWTATSKGFKYKSADVTALLRAGSEDGKSRIKLKAKGTASGVPDSLTDYRQFVADGPWRSATDDVPFLWIGAPVEVELRASNGKCWGVRLEDEVKSTPANLKAKP